MSIRLKRIILLIICIYGFAGGFSSAMIYRIMQTLPSVEALEVYSSLTSKVYDRKNRLFHEFFEERRHPVALENIPEDLVKGVIEMEDRRFYSHCGVDLFGIARAGLFNLLRVKIIQGASTVTQQLARNFFLTFDKSMLRKVKEVILAIRIERVYSKDEILELYFNQIYYGDGAWGIEVAGQRYFGKHAYQLSLPEYALLIGIPKHPNRYNPKINPENARQRRNFILDVMAERGVISKNDADSAKKCPLKIATERSFQGTAPYFVHQVRDWIVARFGAELLYRGGISIYTTLDRDMQKSAENALATGLTATETRFRITDTVNQLQGAIISMVPQTGEILVEVGGRDFRKSMFNRARLGIRQAGSAFKPFTWLAAIEVDSTPSSIVLDEPITISDWGRRYSPVNYDGEFLGPMTLRKALALSRNLVAVRLIMDVGPEKVVGYARRMGITTQLDPVISLALGSCSVTLLDIITAYATFADEGIRHLPISIKRIEDAEGRVLYESQVFSERIISPQSAYIMVSLMKSVLNEGTGIKARYSGFTLPAAGKTGTTDDCVDTYFIGFTPSLICGVWVGYDVPKRIGRHATGSEVSLPIWIDFMKEATKDYPHEDFNVPSGIVWKTVCKKCGKIAGILTKETREEVFYEGVGPAGICTCY